MYQPVRDFKRHSEEHARSPCHFRTSFFLLLFCSLIHLPSPSPLVALWAGTLPWMGTRLLQQDERLFLSCNLSENHSKRCRKLHQTEDYQRQEENRLHRFRVQPRNYWCASQHWTGRIGRIVGKTHAIWFDPGKFFVFFFSFRRQIHGFFAKNRVSLPNKERLWSSSNMTSHHIIR